MICNSDSDEKMTRFEERGQRIRRWRENHRPKMTQQDLADTLGVSSTTVRAWESGYVEQIVKGRQDLLRIMGVSERWLEFGSGEYKQELVMSKSLPSTQVLCDILALLARSTPTLSQEALRSISKYIEFICEQDK